MRACGSSECSPASSVVWTPFSAGFGDGEGSEGGGGGESMLLRGIWIGIKVICVSINVTVRIQVIVVEGKEARGGEIIIDQGSLLLLD